MPTIVYFDTNFYLDYFYNRRDNIRPLGEFAHQALIKVFSGDYSVVVSDWLLEEISKNKASEPMNELIERLKEAKKYVYVSTGSEDIQRAKKLPTHKQDALHVILALKAGATILVTNNLNDFLPCSNLIDCVLPMNF